MQKQLLKITKIKTQRSIVGTTLGDKVKSSDIRSQCDIQDDGPKQEEEHRETTSTERQTSG